MSEVGHKPVAWFHSDVAKLMLIYFLITDTVTWVPNDLRVEPEFICLYSSGPLGDLQLPIVILEPTEETLGYLLRQTG